MNFLVRNAYVLTFAWVLVDQLGLPLPAAPALLAAGALARAGKLQLSILVVCAAVATMISHIGWYEAGRRSGRRVLKLICGISLEPDACVRQTENLFIRHGAKSLLVSNFIPGLGIVAQPLAAVAGVSRSRFLVLNATGALLWAATWSGLGYAFGREIEALGSQSIRFGTVLAVVFGLAVVGYLGWKLWQRRRVLHNLRMARIDARELKRKLDAGERVIIVDLRHRGEREREPEGIPGALQIFPEEMELRHLEIPRGQEVVLYCT